MEYQKTIDSQELHASSAHFNEFIDAYVKSNNHKSLETEILRIYKVRGKIISHLIKFKIDNVYASVPSKEMQGMIEFYEGVYKKWGEQKIKTLVEVMKRDFSILRKAMKI